MQVPRYFLLLDNLFKKLDSIALIDDPLTFSHRPHCHKLPPPRTLCPHRYRRLIPLRFYPPASFWWCFAPAVTRGKRHRSSISSVIRVCTLICLLGAELEKV